VATKIRNTQKLFAAPALPQAPREYNPGYEAQKDMVLRLYFQGVDEALSQALQYDTDDIIDGSIPNSKLENSTVSFGGVTLSLGGSDATPAFDLSDATGYPTSSLVGTITNAQLAGSIANSKLANDSVSYGGVSLDLGQSDATPAFDLSDATNYPTSSLSGTIATAQIADDAVTQAKIADNAIGSDQIASGAVIAGKLQTSSVAATNIQSNAVTTTKINADAVTNAKIADDAVDTAQIADDAVTDAKLADSINSAIAANTAKVTNATHTGEVTGATALTIADNVVDEANLKVSNAPVDGYFLSAQSGNTGGLTWAQVSSGISAVVDDTSPELGGDLNAGDEEIQNVQKLGIGFSGSPSYQLHIEDSKGATSTELVRIKQTGSHTGRIINFYKSSNQHGSIGLTSVIYGQGIYAASQQGGLKFQNQFTTVVVEPCGGDGADKDNSVDLGRSSNRFDDIYATNATIQTSDRNQKQDIAELSDSERRVAVAAKGLLRKYRWIDAVAEKGDNARIHFGIIAQDLEDAFTAEGLDAGRYAMFISTTWWEHDGEKYYEQAHIPEGVTATEVTRRGVRYPELLAFIISAL
jgi:hypothetical protein